MANKHNDFLSVNSKKENSSLENFQKKSFHAMAGVFLSRLSGVIRTLVVNSIFGASLPLDCFNAAFRFPNALRDLLADGALASGFTKVIVEGEKDGEEVSRRTISEVMGFFLTVTILICIIGVIFAKDFVGFVTDARFQASGGLDETVKLFQILIFFLPMTMLNAVIMSLLNYYGLAFRATNSSIFVSVGMIVGALFSWLEFWHGVSVGIFGVAWGAMMGVTMQLWYQMLPLLGKGILSFPDFSIKGWYESTALREVIKSLVPRTLGQGAMVIALSVNTYFATQVGVGTLTYITTAVVFIQVPIGLFGVATGFAALPEMTKAYVQKNYSELSQMVEKAIVQSSIMALIVILGFSLVTVPFYHVVLEHGRITYQDTISNSLAICAYSASVFFSVNSKIFLNVLYAMNEARLVVLNALFYLAVNAFFSWQLASEYGVFGLGLSNGLASAVECGINYYLIQTLFKKSNVPKMGIKKWVLVLSVVIPFVLVFFGRWLIIKHWVFMELTAWKAIIILLLTGMVVGGLFVYLCLRFELQPWKRMMMRGSKKIKD